jgi:hypothetical protein
MQFDSMNVTLIHVLNLSAFSISPASTCRQHPSPSIYYNFPNQPGHFSPHNSETLSSIIHIFIITDRTDDENVYTELHLEVENTMTSNVPESAEDGAQVDTMENLASGMEPPPPELDEIEQVIEAQGEQS